MENKSSTFKTLFFISLQSLLINILVAPLRGGYFNFYVFEGRKLASIVGYLAYYLFTYFIFSKYASRIKSLYLLLSILIGFFVIILPFMVTSFYEIRLTYLQDFIHLLGIGLGFYCFKVRSKKLVSLLGFILALYLSLSGNDYWAHKMDYGTFTGIIEREQVDDITFVTNEGEVRRLSDLKGKYVLCDFWHSACGVCYQEMPILQQLYDKCEHENKLEIYSIHCYRPEKESFTTGKEILEYRNYTFPSLSIELKDPILKQIEVLVFPTVLIFDPENSLVFRGDIKNARDYLKKHIQ